MRDRTLLSDAATRLVKLISKEHGEREEIYVQGANAHQERYHADTKKFTHPRQSASLPTASYSFLPQFPLSLSQSCPSSSPILPPPPPVTTALSSSPSALSKVLCQKLYASFVSFAKHKSNWENDSGSLYDQIYVTVLLSSLSTMFGSSPICIDQNLSLFQNVVRNSIDNWGFYRDNNFLFALISHCLCLKFDMGIYLFSHEISRHRISSKRTFTIDIFLHVLLSFTKRMKKFIGRCNVDGEKSKIISLIDTICCIVDYKISSMNDSVTLMVLSISKEIFELIELSGQTINAINVLCPRVVNLAEGILEYQEGDGYDNVYDHDITDEESLKMNREVHSNQSVAHRDEKMESSTLAFLVLSRSGNISDEKMIAYGNMLLNLFVRQRDLKRQLIIAKELRSLLRKVRTVSKSSPQKLNISSFSSFLRTCRQSLYDYFYEGDPTYFAIDTTVFTKSEWFSENEDIEALLQSYPSKYLKRFCIFCTALLNDEKNLVVSKPGNEMAKSYYLLFESITKLLNANLGDNLKGKYHHGDESTSMRMLHFLGMLTEKVVCPNVANLLYTFYTDILIGRKDFDKGILFLLMQNFATFSLLYESYFDACVKMTYTLATMCLDNTFHANNSNSDVEHHYLSLNSIMRTTILYKKLATSIGCIDAEISFQHSLTLQSNLIKLVAYIWSLFTHEETKHRSYIEYMFIVLGGALEALFLCQNHSARMAASTPSITNFSIHNEYRIFWISIEIIRQCTESFHIEWCKIEALLQKLATISQPFIYGGKGAGYCLVDNDISNIQKVNEVLIREISDVSQSGRCLECIQSINLHGVDGKHTLIISSIALLENERIKGNLDISYFVSYLLDESLSSIDRFHEVLQQLFLDKLFTHWVDIVKRRLQNVSAIKYCMDCITQNFCFYVSRCVHGNARVRAFSIKIVTEILISFRWVARYTKCVFIILDLVEQLSSAHERGTNKAPSSSCISNVMLPTDHLSLSDSLKDAFLLAYLITSIGMNDTPGYATNMFVEYLLLPQVMNKQYHAGAAVVKEISQSCKPIYGCLGSGNMERFEAAKIASKMLHELVCSSGDHKDVGLEKFHSNVDQLISIRSMYVAEASRATWSVEYPHRKDFIHKHCGLFLSKLCESQNLEVEEISRDMWILFALIREYILHSSFGDAYGNHIGYICAQVRSICLCLELFPDQFLLHTYIECLQWLSVGHEGVALVCTELISSLLEMDVQNRVGVFKNYSSSSLGTTEEAHLLASSNQEIINQSDYLDSNEHKLSIHSSMFRVLGTQLYIFPNTSLDAIFQSVSSSMYGLNQTIYDHRIDSRDSTVIFQILSLGLRMISSTITSTSIQISASRRRILREYIYQIVLSWFELPALFEEASLSAQKNVQLFNLMFEFLEQLDRDEAFWNMDYVESDGGGDEYGRSNHCNQFIISSSMQRHQSYPSTSGDWVQLMSDYKILYGLSKPCRGYCALTKLLIHSEMDRLLAWHNDQYFPKNMRPSCGQLDARKANLIQSTFHREFKSVNKYPFYAISSWSFHPLLLIRLTERIPEASCLLKLRSQIGRHTTTVRSIWQAATHVVNYHRTCSNHDASMRAVNELLTFAPSPAYAAIEILNRCDSNGRESFQTGKRAFRSSHSTPSVVRYFIRSMGGLSPQNLLFYLPQLVQLLRRDIFGALDEFLQVIATKSSLLCHNLVWLLQTESISEDSYQRAFFNNTSYSRHGYCQQIIGKDPLPFIASELLKNIMDILPKKSVEFLQKECEYFNSITNISAKLMMEKGNKNVHKQIIKDSVLELGLPRGLYLPTDPNKLVVGIDVDSAAPMQSAAKCPYHLKFNTVAWDGPDSCKAPLFDNVLDLNLPNIGKEQSSPRHAVNFRSVFDNGQHNNSSTKPATALSHGMKDISWSFENMNGPKEWNFSADEGTNDGNGRFEDACIFKVFDDCRQDCLVMQIVQILHDVFEKLKVPLRLKPYSVIPNRTGEDQAIGGIVQVIHDTKSRDQLGKIGHTRLLQHFLSTFGPIDSVEFKAAQVAFASSLAGYAIVCYLLWIKDRHNGNILIDNIGHLYHIDYGFILGISPGGNLGFETAAFKLTSEMIELMGGFKSEAYHTFVQTIIRGFLIARKVRVPLLAIVSAYADSGLPCFNHKEDNLQRMNYRFFPTKRDSKAATKMFKLIKQAERSNRTYWYDVIQHIQQNIHY